MTFLLFVPWGRVKNRTGDRGYDHDKYRQPLHANGISTEIARRGEPHGSGLGKTRWIVERTHRLAAQLQAIARSL